MTLRLPATMVVPEGLGPGVMRESWEGVQANLDKVSQQFPVGAGNLVGAASETVFPVAPVNGQDFYYRADPTGAIWHFKYYKAATGYKWFFVGGSPLTDQQVASGGAAIATGAWNGIDANDPIVTAPLAGDYVLALTATLQTGVAAATVAMGPRLNGATDPVVDTSSAAGFCSVVSARASMRFERVYTSVAAGATFQQRYWHNQGGTDTLNRMAALASLLPIRVAG